MGLENEWLLAQCRFGSWSFMRYYILQPTIVQMIEASPVKRRYFRKNGTLRLEADIR